MEYIGYINTVYYIEQLEAFVLYMKKMPCSFIYNDKKDNGQRQNWKLFISALNNNDTAVLFSFDNAFCNFNEMMFFLKLCSSKNIRIISLKDSLDTSDILFPKVSTQNTLNIIASMTVTKGLSAFDDFQAEMLSDKFHEKKLKKYRMVINMYNAGYWHYFYCSHYCIFFGHSPLLFSCSLRFLTINSKESIRVSISASPPTTISTEST